ncbi:MAG: hypothetical protein R3B06_09955 [Kofleriaceae bacterium]
MKDRARPFSRKHRRYWLTVTGGMFIIMGINLGLGFGVMRCKRPPDPPADYRPIPPPEIPPSRQDAGVAADAHARTDGDGQDAGVAPDASLPDDVER